MLVTCINNLSRKSDKKVENVVKGENDSLKSVKYDHRCRQQLVQMFMIREQKSLSHTLIDFFIYNYLCFYWSSPTFYECMLNSGKHTSIYIIRTNEDEIGNMNDT